MEVDSLLGGHLVKLPSSIKGHECAERLVGRGDGMEAGAGDEDEQSYKCV